MSESCLCSVGLGGIVLDSVRSAMSLLLYSVFFSFLAMR